MQKVKSWRVFDTKRNGDLLLKKIKESEGKEKWVQEEGDQENKRSNKKGNEKIGEWETWWTKTRSDAKEDGRKTCKKEKHKKSKEIHFNTEDLEKKRKDKKETKLTLKKKSRKKEDPSMKKTAWFCQIVRVKGKTFSKEK